MLSVVAKIKVLGLLNEDMEGVVAWLHLADLPLHSLLGLFLLLLGVFLLFSFLVLGHNIFAASGLCVKSLL